MPLAIAIKTSHDGAQARRAAPPLRDGVCSSARSRLFFARACAAMPRLRRRYVREFAA